MRPLLRELALSGVVLVAWAAPARAQQGSIQITGSTHAVTGDPARLGGQPTLEPDAGVSWLQPGSRIGTFQMELRGTRRGDEPHLGKAFASWRNVKLGPASWNFEVGDLHFTPVIGDYRFTNLTTPAITFMGGAVSARTARSSASVVAGRVTAWRNIFGSDPDTLGQEVALAHGTYKAFDWLELNARASRIRTRNVREFSYTIAASDQAGGGARFTAGPMQFVADGSAVSYRRAGSPEQVRDASMMAGVSLLLARGWLQINAARFSPGDFPLLNYPLLDREVAFAAGEYDIFQRLRVFGGGEAFRSNLDPARSAIAQQLQPQSTGARGFGGVRFQLTGRNTVAVRMEDGDRRSRRIGDTGIVQSDTGVVSAELQSHAGPVTGFFRYSWRENQSFGGGSSYTQDDGAAQLFVNVSRGVQLFGTGMATRNRLDAGGGTTFYQFGGGGQTQIGRRHMWLRVEGLAARNVDLFTQNLVARTSFDVGFNGQVARHTTIGLNLHADRLPPGAAAMDPWVTRTLLRVTRSFPTGSARVGPAVADAAAVTRARGTATVAGLVFEDWDADGVADPDERPLEAIPLLLGTVGNTVTSARGEFSFVNVPTGLQRVGLDLSALPVDFDAPAVSGVQIELTRNESRRITFGLVPLGSVGGRVLRDANASGTIDAGDEPLDSGVLVLDGGARTEAVRKGQFRFDAVRAGSHTIDLLQESLPDGATIVSERSVAVPLTKTQPNPVVDFLVKVEKRPEIRRVFPPKGGGAAQSQPSRAAAPKPAPVASRADVRPAAGAGDFTIQVAALSDASRAMQLVTELKAAGYPAYLVEPAAGDASGFYRIRVGRFNTRGAVNKVLPALEKRRGEKLWVIRER